MGRTDGVSVEVSKNGNTEKTGLKDYGYISLGKMDVGAHINVKVPKRASILGIAIDVDGKKNITEKKNYSETEDKVYKTKVGITNDDGTMPNHTHYPGNNMRLLLADYDGAVELWEIALISQNGFFFLTTQKTYEAQCYTRRGDTELLCPYFETHPHKWPQLVAFLRQACKDKTAFFPKMGAYRPIPDVSNHGLEHKQGRVKWYNLTTGLGEVITRKGSVRVCWRDVAYSLEEKAPLLLRKGEVVEYKYLTKPKTTHRSTRFLFQAHGIKRVNLQK